MSTSSSRPPRRLRVVGVLALIWNLIGVAAFVMQLALPAEALQAMPPERRAIYEATPAWLYLFYALATFGGALGAAALLLRRRWAAPVFAIALAALLLQIVAGYATTPAWAIGGLASLGFPVLLVGVAAALLVFARRMAARGVLR